MDIRTGDVVLSNAMEFLHARVQNLSKVQYSFCCSLSGCLPSRMAVDSQGVAIGEIMFQHFVLSSIAELFSKGQSLQGSCRYFQRYRCKMRRFVPSGGAVQSLQGSDRYSLRHSRRIVPADTSFMSLKGSNRYSLPA